MLMLGLVLEKLHKTEQAAFQHREGKVKCILDSSLACRFHSGFNVAWTKIIMYSVKEEVQKVRNL